MDLSDVFIVPIMYKLGGKQNNSLEYGNFTNTSFSLVNLLSSSRNGGKT